MKCPFCGEDTTKVIDSRPSDDNTAIRRRRMCEVCNRRFTTYEKIEVFPLMVVKKDQTREAYSREKLKTGIVMACHKRPIPTDAVNRLVDDIETTIFNNYEKEVSSMALRPSAHGSPSAARRSCPRGCASVRPPKRFSAITGVISSTHGAICR